MKLRSAQGDVLEIDSATTGMCGFLRQVTMDDVDEGSDADLPLLDVETETLSRVIEYCKRCQDHAASTRGEPANKQSMEGPQAWERLWIQNMTQEAVCKLALASDYLDIPELFAVAIAKLGLEHDWKDVNHRKCFAVQHVRLVKCSATDAAFLRIILAGDSRIVQVQMAGGNVKQSTCLLSKACITSARSIFNGMAFKVTMPELLARFSIGLTSGDACDDGNADFELRCEQGYYVNGQETLKFEVYEGGQQCGAHCHARQGTRVQISVSEEGSIVYRFNSGDHDMAEFASQKPPQYPLRVMLRVQLRSLQSLNLNTNETWCSIAQDLQWTCVEKQFPDVRNVMYRDIIQRGLHVGSKRRRLHPTLSM
eukprot:TRINITY_DN4584_c0_g1_i1.p1 TRINITY_DN4584_c0_g1~~TRINITY_DN4584_c0_g1_i1.p1  ORF type:complete len:367 (-),score=50.60 TRINITY_DN4584_c0_g1_i1:140-1240(-)